MNQSSKSSPMLQIKELKIQGSLHCRYLVSLPPTYDEDSKIKWPIVLFLHGSGESSKDIELAKKHGIPRLVQVYDNWRNGNASKDDILNNENTNESKTKEKDSSVKPVKPISLDCAKFVAENFITVTPQLDPDEGEDWKLEPLAKLLDEVESNYRADKDRIYITGVSMGGFGTFNMAVAYPTRFAALIPICGGGQVDKAGLIKHIPAWVFHGQKDDIVPIISSEEMVNAMRKLEGDVRFTTYHNADHDSWTDTYNNIEIYKWLLSHKKV